MRAREVRGVKIRQSLMLPTLIGSATRQGVREVYVDARLAYAPEQMVHAVQEHAALKITGLTINASAGYQALKAASDNKANLLLIAHTVSSSRPEYPIDSALTLEERVLRLGKTAAQAGIDAVRCPGCAMDTLRREELTRHMVRIATGIRIPGQPCHDSAASVEPAQAIENGAHILEIDQAITDASDPDEALERIIAHIR